uniref:Uncharacterized protein n=1 Tax=Lactuca sativa TaxID=4236 RepID=A0A9R1VGB1_LACSA|nr:hypothetical protein LSAT_V11C500244500 [Lactuca sativa]
MKTGARSLFRVRGFKHVLIRIAGRQRLDCTQDYSNKAPTMRFVCCLFHPNSKYNHNSISNNFIIFMQCVCITSKINGVLSMMLLLFSPPSSVCYCWDDEEVEHDDNSDFELDEDIDYEKEDTYKYKSTLTYKMVGEVRILLLSPSFYNNVLD